MSERREHRPFPGKQQRIWRSSLRGMEQPIRSFKSFIRTASPLPPSYGNKPLPPVPIPQEDPTVVSTPPSNTIPSNRTASVDWKAPAEWNEQIIADEDPLPSPNFTTRNYAPLIPEPSPSNLEAEEPSSWPFDVNSSQFSRLKSINEQDDIASLHSSACPSELSLPFPAESQLGSVPSLRNHSVLLEPEELGHYSLSSVPRHIVTMPPASPSSDTARMSHASTKQKAYASLGIEFPDEKQMIQELRSDQAKSPLVNDGFHSTLSMHGKKLQSLHHENIQDAESPIDADMYEKMQQLSVSQDYHDILAEQYQTEHAHDSWELFNGNNQSSSFARGSAPRSNHGALVPRPLSWKKDSTGSLPSESQPTRKLDSRQRYRKVTNWVPFHQPIHLHNRIHRNEKQAPSANDSATPARGTTPGPEMNRFSKRDHHLSDLFPRVKGLKSQMKRVLASDGITTHATSRSNTPQPTMNRSSPPLEPPPRLFRLPVGLALVRQSQTSTPNLSITSNLEISTPLNLSHSSPQPEVCHYDMSPNERRPSSLYSQQSEVPVAPGISIKRKLRISAGPPPSPQSRSNTSSPPTSPLAHEVSFPRTPPLAPPPRILSLPRVQSGLSHSIKDLTDDDERADSANEDEPHKRTLHVGILDRARDARDARKRHQKDAKHEKLKQSIRILGPIDPGATVAYVRPQSRILEHEGVDGIRVPGYMSGSML